MILIIITVLRNKAKAWLSSFRPALVEGQNMTLWELPQMDSAVLTGFDVTTPDRYKSRLCELGFDQGEEVTCMRITPFGGPRVYKIGDGVFSIDRDMAKQILVKSSER